MSFGNPLPQARVIFGARLNNYFASIYPAAAQSGSAINSAIENVESEYVTPASIAEKRFWWIVSRTTKRRRLLLSVIEGPNRPNRPKSV